MTNDAGLQREYLLRLSLPPAQLSSRARNAKDARGRHDNTSSLFGPRQVRRYPAAACYLGEQPRPTLFLPPPGAQGGHGRKG